MKHLTKLLTALTLAAAYAGVSAAADTSSTEQNAPHRTSPVAQLHTAQAHTPMVDRRTVAALARCNVHRTADDIALCQRRITHGEVSGSVQGGGILRTYSETVYLQPSQE